MNRGGDLVNRIPGIQLFWLVTSFDLGMALFVVLAPTIQTAHRDAWLSTVLATAASAFVTYVVVRVNRRYPDLTLIDYAQVILGKWLGRLVALLTVLQWTMVNGVIIRQTIDVLITSNYHRTPMWVFAVTITALAIYALSQGALQSLSRVTLLLGPIVLVALAGTIAVNISSIQFERLLPVYASTGTTTILAGAIPSFGFLGQAVLVGMFAPMMQHPQRMGLYAVGGVAVSGIVLTMGVVMVVGMFGSDLPARMWNPFLDGIRYISIAELFEKLDAVIVLAWFMSTFVRITVFLYVSTYGWARLFHIKNWRPLLWVIGSFDMVLALWPHNIISTIVTYVQVVHQPWAIPILLVAAPLLLWIVSAIRDWLNMDRRLSRRGGR